MYSKPISLFSLKFKPRFTLLLRQCGFVVLPALFLISCNGTPPKIGSIGVVESFHGAAISEEPRAALAARDILSIGGTAADAAVTAFFVMTVTYPVAVGLGGGGICLYYDHQSNKAKTLDFRVSHSAAGGEIAVPGALRGLALLHSRYGDLPWSKLVTPAETMARFGHRITRALAKRLRSQANRLRSDRMSRRIFLGRNGYPLGESETLIQIELASVLSGIRTRGVGDFYGGDVGQRFVQSAARRGGKISISDLRKYRAVWRETAQIPVGNHVLHYPDLGKSINLNQSVVDSVKKKSSILAKLRISEAKKKSSVVDKGQAGFVIGDKFGSAASCIFDMGNAFGVATMAPELGIFMSPIGKTGGAGQVFLGVNEHVSQTLMAVTGAGGSSGALSAAALAIDVMENGLSLDNAMAKNNVGNTRIQGLWCPNGIRTKPEGCQFATDPRWHGLAAFDAF